MNFTSQLKDFKGDLRRKSATLKNWGTDTKVAVMWDLNQNTITDQIFKIELQKGDTKLTAYLNKEEMLHYLGAV